MRWRLIKQEVAVHFSGLALWLCKKAFRTFALEELSKIEHIKRIYEGLCLSQDLEQCHNITR